MNNTNTVMNRLFILILSTSIISCSEQSSNNEILFETHPFLEGKWTGEGRFFDVDLDENYGIIPVEIAIRRDTVLGTFGKASLSETSITEADYGFEIKGLLDSEFSNKGNLEKDHLIILLVIPEENRDRVKSSEANFHLKSNYIFDFGMRVGGVNLIRE